MASSRSIIGKSRSISASQSPDHLQGPDRRTPRSSVLSSPENHHQAQQRRPLMRSSSDVLKMSKNQEQTSGVTAATKRQPIRKPIERNLSLREFAAQTTVKERVPRTTPATISRPTISEKSCVEKASTSRVASKTATRSQPVLKTKTAIGLTKKKSSIATNTANKNEKSSDVVSENENHETSTKFEVIEQLDDISRTKVSEFSGVICSGQPENHASSIASDVDEELNHVNENQEKEEYINKSKNSIETTAAAETVEENKIELGQNSMVIGHHAGMIVPSSETANIIDKTASIVSTDATENAVRTSTNAEKSEIVHGMRTETPKINEVIEETRNKLFEHRKSKVKALVGAFETVMS